MFKKFFFSTDFQQKLLFTISYSQNSNQSTSTLLLNVIEYLHFLPIMDLQSHQSNVPLSSKIEQLRAWLTTTNQFFESINLKKEQRRLSYADYQQFRKELETQENLYSHLKTQHEEGKHDTLWKDIDTNW